MGCPFIAEVVDRRTPIPARRLVGRHAVFTDRTCSLMAFRDTKWSGRRLLPSKATLFTGSAASGGGSSQL